MIERNRSVEAVKLVVHYNRAKLLDEHIIWRGLTVKIIQK